MSDQDGITALDLVAPEALLGAASNVRDAADWTLDRVLLLTDDDLLVWDGALRPSPLADALAGASLSDIEVLGDDLWLAGENGLSVWRDGVLSTISLEGEIAHGPLATGRIGDWSAVWVGTDTSVVALTRTGADVIALESHALPAPDAMAVDKDGSLWVAAGGRLHRRDSEGAWSEFALPAPVTRVAGNRSSARIWVATESGVLSAVSGEFTAVENATPNASSWSVDDVGRLLEGGADGLSRLSIGRPVAVRGLPNDDLLLATSDLYIAPTALDQVVGVNASLGGVNLTIEDLGGVWRATLEPAEIDAGEYDLAVSVNYSALSSTAQWKLIIVNPTWENDIQPLFQARCSACHGGTTGTATLNTPEAWEMRFDEIVDRVTRNNMPLGLEPLSDLQKGMIRAWGAKGFPR